MQRTANPPPTRAAARPTAVDAVGPAMVRLRRSLPGVRMPARALGEQQGRLERAALRLLPVAAALVVWGPPTLRPGGRSLTAALEEPLALDFASAVQVGSWVLATFVVAVLTSAAVRRRRVLAWATTPAAFRWFGVYGLFALASTLWSVSPLYTAFFAIQIPVTVALLVFLLDTDPLGRVDRPLFFLYAVMAVQAAASVLAFLIDPRLVGEGDGLLFSGYRLTGGTLKDYGASPLLAGIGLLTVAVFTRDRRRRVWAVAGYVATLPVLLASLTRAAIGTAGISALILASQTRRWRARAAIASALILAGWLVLPGGPIARIFGIATRHGDGLATLTGRTVAYDFLVEVWAEAPIVGHGYGAGTRAALVEFVERTGFGIGAGHDVVSTTLVDLGLLGLALLTAVFVAAAGPVLRLWRATAAPRLRHVRAVVVQVVCLLVWTVIEMVVARSIAGPFPPFAVLLVTTAALRRVLQAEGPAPAPLLQARRPDEPAPRRP